MELAKRDGLKISNIVAELLEEWIRRKAPGNPQRPITAYIRGHRDHLTRIRKEALRRAEEMAGWRREIEFREIRELLREVPDSRTRNIISEEIARELSRRGVRVWR